jgi:hypothetical protein
VDLELIMIDTGVACAAPSRASSQVSGEALVLTRSVVLSPIFNFLKLNIASNSISPEP